MSLEDAPERFEAKIERAAGGCWRWTAATNGKGYGLFASGVTTGKRGGSKLVLAHRWSYEYHKGTPIPDGMDVIRTCGNVWCVAPRHLELVEPAETQQRAQRARRPRRQP